MVNFQDFHNNIPDFGRTNLPEFGGNDPRISKNKSISDDFFKLRKVLAAGESEIDLKKSLKDKKTREYFMQWVSEHANLTHYVPQLSKVYQIARSEEAGNRFEKIIAKMSRISLAIPGSTRDNVIEDILNTSLERINFERLNKKENISKIIGLYQAGVLNDERLLVLLNSSSLRDGILGRHVAEFLPLFYQLAIVNSGFLTQLLPDDVLKSHFQASQILLEELAITQPDWVASFLAERHSSHVYTT